MEATDKPYPNEAYARKTKFDTKMPGRVVAARHLPLFCLKL